MAAEKLDLNGAVQTLDSTFKAMPKWRPGAVQVGTPMLPLSDPSFSWAAGYIWDHPIIGNKAPWPAKSNFPAFTANNDADADPNGDMIAQHPESNPFLFDPGSGLCIVAQAMPASLKALVSAKDAPATYLSGSITSYPYCQTYGVFSMRAQIPKGYGIKPAFWMLPYDLSWPPEIDIMEILAGDPKTIYFTLHVPNAPQIGNYAKLPFDLSEGYHDYMVDWGPKLITFYVDGVQYWQAPTPASMHKPMYLLANLTVSKPKEWGGAPHGGVYAIMRVKSVKAWQRPEYVGAK